MSNTTADTADTPGTQAPSAPHTVTLETPIERGATRIETVVVRKPLAGALRGISLTELLQLQTDALRQLLPRVTEPPLIAAEIDRLDPADLVQLGSEVIGFFIPAAQRSPTA